MYWSSLYSPSPSDRGPPNTWAEGDTMSSFFQDSRILSDLQNSPLITEALGLSLWEGFLRGVINAWWINIILLQWECQPLSTCNHGRHTPPVHPFQRSSLISIHVHAVNYIPAFCHDGVDSSRTTRRRGREGVFELQWFQLPMKRSGLHLVAQRKQSNLLINTYSMNGYIVAHRCILQNTYIVLKQRMYKSTHIHTLIAITTPTVWACCYT